VDSIVAEYFIILLTVAGSVDCLGGIRPRGVFRAAVLLPLISREVPVRSIHVAAVKWRAWVPASVISLSCLFVAFYCIVGRRMPLFHHLFAQSNKAVWKQQCKMSRTTLHGNWRLQLHRIYKTLKAHLQTIIIYIYSVPEKESNSILYIISTKLNIFLYFLASNITMIIKPPPKHPTLQASKTTPQIRWRMNVTRLAHST